MKAEQERGKHKHFGKSVRGFFQRVTSHREVGFGSEGKKQKTVALDEDLMHSLGITPTMEDTGGVCGIISLQSNITQHRETIVVCPRSLFFFLINYIPGLSLF